MNMDTPLKTLAPSEPATSRTPSTVGIYRIIRRESIPFAQDWRIVCEPLSLRADDFWTLHIHGAIP
jgi:hypothetical protein